MTIKQLQDLIPQAQAHGPQVLVVAAAEDQEVLLAISQAQELGIISPILVGDQEKIQQILGHLNYHLPSECIINIPDQRQAAHKSVQLIREGRGQILMKGLLGSADYLRAILDKEQGLITKAKKVLSHVAFFQSPFYHKIFAITDAALNVAPSFEEKVSICQNAVDLFQRLGVTTPKVAVAAAVETVNPKMEATIHGAMLTLMNRRQQIKNCLIDGPLALDNIISVEAAQHKGICSEVAGDADIILVPEITAGNLCYKTLTYLAGASVVGIVVGAQVPVVLTSRADSAQSKLLSIALAVTISEGKNP